MIADKPTTIGDHFARLFPDADKDKRLSACKELIRLYNQEHRHYHTTDHIHACFHELEKTGYGGANRDVVDFAILCHDVFYEPNAVNNEWRSAVWAKNVSRLLSRPELGAPVAEAILLTAHSPGKESPSFEAALVCDVDLSILGANKKTFDEYEEFIREEYSWVTDKQYRTARAEILRGLLDNGPIYRWYVYQALYQTSAEKNLTRSLAKLARPTVGEQFWKTSDDE